MIPIKSEKEIAIMREGGRILASVLAELALRAKVPGTKLADLDALAESLIRAKGGAPSFKGYRPQGASRSYPASLCLSLNDGVVHGLPDTREIHEGDVVKLDLGVFYKGFHTDSALTVIAGRGKKEDCDLLIAAEKALEIAIDLVRPGIKMGEIGRAIESYTRERGYSIIRTLSGHGIGRDLHEEPNVPNFGRPGTGPELVVGMTFAIEPMVAAGGGEVYLAEDGFTYKTRDGSAVAHFEHTVAVTKKGCEILTKL